MKVSVKKGKLIKDENHEIYQVVSWRALKENVRESCGYEFMKDIYMVCWQKPNLSSFMCREKTLGLLWGDTDSSQDNDRLGAIKILFSGVGVL